MQTLHRWAARAAGTVALTLALAASAFAQPITPETKHAVMDTLVEVVDKRAYASGVDFAKLKEHLTKYAAVTEGAVDQRAFAAALNKSLKEFGISHIRLLSPASATSRRSTDRIGIGITTRRMDDGLVIQELVEGGPGEAAGLRIGDVILKIDGTEATTTEPLGGDEGTKVMLLVRRAGGVQAPARPAGAHQTTDAPAAPAQADPDGAPPMTPGGSTPAPSGTGDVSVDAPGGAPGAPGLVEKQEEITVTRGKFSVRKPETLVKVAPDAAVLRIATFSVGYDTKRIDALFAQAREEGIKFLVLDVRSNGGGRVTNLNHLLSYFFPRDTEIGTNVSRALAKRFVEETGEDGSDAVLIAKWGKPNFRVRAQQENRFPGRVAVLIDRGSASASEIAASSLRELRGAPLVGVPSAGAVLVSVHLPLAQGWEVQIPISDYVTAKGMRLEAHRLKPDAEVIATRAKDGGLDPVVEKALALLRAMKEEPSPAAPETAPDKDAAPAHAEEPAPPRAPAPVPVPLPANP
ncbi:hypothetical protein BH11PLA1_BH11PLA1_02470 [soil metagenome]